MDISEVMIPGEQMAGLSFGLGCREPVNLHVGQSLWVGVSSCACFALIPKTAAANSVGVSP